MVTVTGHDGTFSTTVYDRKMYEVDDIIKDRYFADIMEAKSNKEFYINYTNFDKIN
jgi:inward rectifier potassium channel